MNEECCNQNCNQGRDCPLRKTEPSDDEIWKLWVKHLNDDIIVFAREVLKKANEK
jgi:hypothetical protein